MEEKTSWEKVSRWYSESVGKKGSYYHQRVVLPQSLKLLALKKSSSLLDLACGQGVLARQIPKEVYYVGVDISPGLLTQAKRLDQNPRHTYIRADITGELPLKTDFTHAAILLALQNVSDSEGVIRNVAKHLKTGGNFLIVINHPCFRIPRQTRWETDVANRTVFRRVDSYMSRLDVPIDIHPGKGEKSDKAWAFHLPLSEYSRMLAEYGFVIARIEEWVSGRQSVGAAARMENRARKEFPLFMAILAKKEL